MGRIGTGAKAGVVSGIVYGAISSITTYITALSIKEEIISAIRESLPHNLPITAEQLFEFALILLPILAILFGLVTGIILGAIYGWGYEKIPGGNSVYKGLVIGVIFWIISFVLVGLGNLQYGTAYVIVSLAWSLVIALVFGALLGVFSESIPIYVIILRRLVPYPG